MKLIGSEEIKETKNLISESEAKEMRFKETTDCTELDKFIELSLSKFICIASSSKSSFYKIKNRIKDMSSSSFVEVNGTYIENCFQLIGEGNFNYNIMEMEKLQKSDAILNPSSICGKWVCIDELHSKWSYKLVNYFVHQLEDSGVIGLLTYSKTSKNENPILGTFTAQLVQHTGLPVLQFPEIVYTKPDIEDDGF